MNTSVAVITLDHTDCCRCHAIFGLEKRAHREYRESGKCLYCPYCGTRQSYRTSELQRLKSRLEKEEARRERAEQNVLIERRWRKSEERSKAAVRGHLTRVKNRIANGVCPCCDRHFENLGRHMKHQHPGYVEEIDA